MTTSDLATYEQAVAFQNALVHRAILQRTQVHAIIEAEERPEYGSVWLTCSCREHFAFKADDADRGEQRFVSHVRAELRLAVAA